MFTAAEFRLIRENCTGDLQKLLAILKISDPNWSGDEFKIYEKLDAEIVNRICRLLKSESILEGYTNLMTFGGLKFNYSETENELLATILQNKDSVMRGATQSISVQTQQTVTESRPQKVTKTVEKKVFLPVLIVVGIVLIIAGIVVSNSIENINKESTFSNSIGNIGAGIAGILGFVSLALGFKGKTVKETIEVDNGSPVQRQVTSETKKAPFTKAEIQQIFEVLTQVNKIVHSI